MLWPIWRAALIGTCVSLCVAIIEFGLPALPSDARRALEILLVAIIGWTLTRFDDAFVAIAAGLAMALLVNRDPGALFHALGDELIWLLLASFILAATIKASGVADRVLGLVTGRMRSVRAIAYSLTAVMIATAFVIPSTSGRAALMIPPIRRSRDAVEAPGCEGPSRCCSPLLSCSRPLHRPSAPVPICWRSKWSAASGV
ncbi:anion permease [Mesorhizobium sp. M0678]|uniref:anion permease n=1 Tax=Mesorhizobium sp. M0678 TaxID=2956985 RepID=UPI00333B65CF